MNKASRSRTSSIAWLGILIAVQVVLARFTIGSNSLKVGFSFVVTGMIGYYFGPWKSALAGLVSDLIGNIVFPPQGGFFVGFTISAIVAGLIYGLVLYKKEITWWRVLIAIVLVSLIVNLVLNTLWVNIMYPVPTKVLWATRIWPRAIKELIFIPFETIVLYIVLKWISKHNFD